VPLYLERDVGGPMTRTVEDAARVLDVVAGYDPPTRRPRMREGHIPATYTAFLDADALRGARIGVVRRYTEATTRTARSSLFDAAVRDLERAGATIIDPVELPFIDSIRSRSARASARRHRGVPATRPGAPQTLAEIIESGATTSRSRDRLRSLARDTMGGESGALPRRRRRRRSSSERLRGVLREHRSTRSSIRRGAIRRADRRPPIAARRQQPGARAAQRVPGDHGARWATRTARCPRDCSSWATRGRSRG
jgi:Asp-tRNA(Asn)/Glu-tRNA(Gln) amidotransferase A subunit family amidase